MTGFTQRASRFLSGESLVALGWILQKYAREPADELIAARHRCWDGQPLQGGKSDEAFRCSASLGGRSIDTGHGV